ncbi:MAG: TetR/AcrR family transcriptional regulator [Pseudomonadota bacterium]
MGQSLKQGKKGQRAQRAPKHGQIDRTINKVLKTTSSLLRKHGYRQLTIDMVANESGVARSTLYRHWSNVAELTIAAFDAALGPNPPPPNLGDLRSDLVFAYTRFHSILKRSLWGSVMPSLIEASKTDPRFAGLLERLVDERRATGRLLFTRAIEQGEIHPDSKIEWAIDALTGAYYHRLLMTGAPLDEDGMVEWLVDAVLHQMLVEKPAT